MNRSEQINELAAALAKAQGDLKGAVKDSANPFFKSKYADLASVWDACRTPLSKNGLSIIQTHVPSPDEVVVETTLAHSSGQWISSVLSAKPVKNDPQGIGSCITYLRRYSLSSMVGIAPEDDDGNAASHSNGNGNGYHKESPLPPEGKSLEKNADELVISEAQRKRLWAICKKHEVTEARLKAYLLTKKIESTKDIARRDYETVCGVVESGKLTQNEAVQEAPAHDWDAEPQHEEAA
jgi:hypothetical protein